MLALVSSFLWGVIWLIFPSIAGLCHSALQLIEQLNQKGRTINLEFQIYGSALIEPQILQSNETVKSSGQFFRNPGSNELEPEFWKIAQMASWVLLKCVFGGLKMAKKWLFQIFHEVQTYKKYILQKKWSKNLIPAPGNGWSNLPPPYMRLPPPTRWSTPIANEQ